MDNAVTKYNEVLSVIKKLPANRNDFEVNALLPWFRKRSKLFESLKPGNSSLQSMLIYNCIAIWRSYTGIPGCTLQINTAVSAVVNSVA